MVVELNRVDVLPQLEDIDEYCETLIKFLEKHSFLMDIPILDFLTHPHKYDKIPLSWRELCNSKGEKSLEEFRLIDDLIGAVGCGIVQDNWPEDLKEFITTCHKLPLHNYYFDDSLFDPKIEENFELEPKYLVRMNVKKQHEVKIMAKYISEFSKKLNLDTVVDLGSGQGYLSRILAHHFNLNIIGIDGDKFQTSGAERIDQKFSKYNNANRSVTISRHTSFIDKSTLPSLITLPTNRSLISGLHTCGQLGYDTIDMFTSSSATGLVSVSCCYHRLDPFISFPQSQALKRKSPLLENVVGKLGLKVACQIPLTWLDYPDRCKEFFKRHFYRALFQKLLQDWNFLPPASDEKSNCDFKNSSIVLGKLPDSAFTNFQVYCQTALDQLKFTLPLPSTTSLETYLDDYYVTNLSHYPKVVLTWSLQSILAPIVESLLLIDRKFYLEDKLPNKVEANIVPLFHCKKSPRSFALVAKKLP